MELAQTHPQNRAVLAAYPRASRALSWCAFEAELAADGEVLLPLLPRGAWELELLAGSRQAETRSSPILTERVVLAPGERQRLVLAQPPLVRGEVRHGEEKATCLLTFERAEGEVWERSLWSDGRGRFVLLGAEQGLAVDTDAAGEAELSLAAPLSHPLNIMADVPGWGRIPFLLGPRPGEAEEPMELVLPPAGGEIELLAPEADPDEPLTAFLVRADGALAFLAPHPEERWARAAGEGRWVLGPLGPGSYRLLLLPWPAGPRGPADVAAALHAAWAATSAQGQWVTVVSGQRTVLTAP